MDDEMRKFYCLPPLIIENWRDERGKLSFYYMSEDASEKQFMFSASDDIPGEEIVYDAIEVGNFRTFLESILEGRIEYNRESLLSAWKLYLYVTTWSCINASVCYTEDFEEPDDVCSINQLISHLYAERGELSTSSLREIASEYMHDAEYLGGLDYCLLKAPENSSFILSDVPFIIFNPFQKNRETGNTEDYTACGVVLVLVISPDYALCFYDGDVYRVRKTNGVAVLDCDDMNELHSQLLSMSTAAVYRRDRTTVRSLDLLSNVADEYLYRTVTGKSGEEETHVDLVLSVLSVRAEAEDNVTGGRAVPLYRSSYNQMYSFFDEKKLNASILEKYLSRYDS